MGKKFWVLAGAMVAMWAAGQATQAKTQKPPRHGRHWMPVTGKPLEGTAGVSADGTTLSTAPFSAYICYWNTLTVANGSHTVIATARTGSDADR